MSAVAEPLPHIVPDDNLARRNALVLAAAQALAGGNNTVIVSTASIVGAVLAPDKGLATLPVTSMVFGMWLGTLPVGMLARKFGRRFALQSGSVFGVLSGLISYFAVIGGDFWLLLFGTFCGGLYAAAHQSYRFAAADTASDAYRPKVVSWVLAGGVFAAVLGPQLVIFTKDILTPHLFAATYLGQSLCAVAAACVLQLVKVPPLAPPSHGSVRALGDIVRSPRFIVAVACGIASYAMMNMLMTSAPLAMVGCGHSVTDAALGIQWHVLAMYAPSFITGSLIARFGVERVTGVGLLLIAATAAASHASAASASTAAAVTTTIASPPPRGTGRSCRLRSLGRSRGSEAAASMRRTMIATAAAGTTRASAALHGESGLMGALGDAGLRSLPSCRSRGHGSKARGR